MHLIIPKNYNPVLNLRDTEIAIKLVKDFFETELARALNLTRVSAPIMVTPGSGLNDNLNGVERPVSFDVLETGETAEIVHSLAKWKRQALKTYGFQPGEGLYTDMNAIRRDETTDNIHSIFVDQWDWEKIITPKQRTMETLQATVRAIYLTLRKTEGFVCAHYPHIKPELPDDITFVSSQELEDLYPDLPPKEREYRAVREYGAVFLTGIGGALRSGQMHDGRAPDYDDWSLNGDILLYDPLLDIALKVSSMGIRVDPTRCAVSWRFAAARSARSCHSRRRCSTASCPRRWAAASGRAACASTCCAKRMWARCRQACGRRTCRTRAGRQIFSCCKQSNEGKPEMRLAPVLLSRMKLPHHAETLAAAPSASYCTIHRRNVS